MNYDLDGWPDDQNDLIIRMTNWWSETVWLFLDEENEMPEVMKSNAERLDVLLEKHAPKAVAYHKTHKVWPGPDADFSKSPKEAVDAHIARLMDRDGMSEKEARLSAEISDMGKRRAPYEIKTIDDGNAKRILLTKDDGTVIAGSGDTVADALTKLESL